MEQKFEVFMDKNNDVLQSFSLRKIPTVKHSDIEIKDKNNYDKVKILELSNAIDKWERDVLFSENGFFSFQGKNAEGKTKEFERELNDFINRQIANIKFNEKVSYEIVSDIKKKKLSAIRQQMQVHEIKELKNWEISVYETALTSAIKRAVAYKNNSGIVNSSYKNALEVLKVMAEKENWNSKTFKTRKENFETEFYLSLINSFVNEQDVTGAILYENFKEKINLKEKDKVETALKSMKSTIISYNFAKELFSYELTEKENDKEINKVNDKEKETLIRKFLSDFKKEKDADKENKEAGSNEENWRKIIEVSKSEPENAVLYIDTFLDEKSQNAKRKYIDKILKDGFISTDKKLFIELIENSVEDFEKFKKKKISDLHSDLSSEDFLFIEELKGQTDIEQSMFVSDFNYVKKELLKLKITEISEIYSFVKLVLNLKKNYEETNKKTADLEVRNKIIKSALERYQQKKQEDKNDSFINSSGK